MERNRQEQYDPAFKAYALEIFSSDAYLTINKELLSQFGPELAVFISNLIDKYKYFLKRNELLDGDWFFMIQENQMKQTGLSQYKLRSCITNMVSCNILETRKIGLPAKIYYKINFDVLVSSVPRISRRLKTGGQDFKKPDVYIKDPKDINKKEKLNKKKKVVSPDLFDKFWSLYPKKAGKGQAMSAWEKLCKNTNKDRPTWKEIKLAIINQKESRQWKLGQIANASTWINQKRWLDDPAEMMGFQEKKTGPAIGYKEENKTYRKADIKI